MSQQPKSERLVLATATGLFLSLSLLCTAYNALFGQFKWFISFGFSTATLAAISHKLKITGEEYAEVYEILNGAVLPEIQESIATIVASLPEDVQISFQRKESNYDWLLEATEFSTLIFGLSNSGKTFLQLLFLEARLKANPNSYIRILDIDYQKRENNWGGFPLQSIVRLMPDEENSQQFVERCKFVIDEFYTEVNRRATDGNSVQADFYQPWILLIDELASVLPFVGQPYIAKIEEIGRRGNGFNVSILMGTVNAAVNVAGLPEGIKDQWNRICVNPSRAAQMKEFKLESADKIAIFAEATATKKRCAVTQLRDIVSVSYIPDRTENPPCFVKVQDQAESWISLVENTVKELRESDISISKAWVATLKEFPVRGNKPKQLNDDPYYCLFKQLWDSIEVNEKQLVGV